MASLEQSIVIVEDDAGMRKAIERLLRAAGFRSVESFPSAEALLGSHAAEIAGCLVLDINLPGLSGMDLQRRLTAGGCNRPVIFITGHDQPGLREEAELLKCAGYFPKPFDGNQWIDVIRQVLSSQHT
jgi:FixJ family two-component response regulator